MNHKGIFSFVLLIDIVVPDCTLKKGHKTNRSFNMDTSIGTMGVIVQVIPYLVCLA